MQVSSVSDYVTKEIIQRNEELNKEFDTEAKRIMREMKTEIEQTAPLAYPYRDMHMQGGWKTSVKQLKRKGVTSYGVYNANVPQLTHLVALGHKVVIAEHRNYTTKRPRALVRVTAHIGAPYTVVPPKSFMDNAQEKAQEKLDRAIERLIEEFNNGE